MSQSRFPKSCRLLKTADFDRVFNRRRSRADGMLVLFTCENDVGFPRLGMVVSRKVGGSVLRTRWKRCLREAFRLSQGELPPLDYVVLPRPGATPTMHRIQTSLLKLAPQS